MGVAKAICCARVRGGKAGEAFGEDAARTLGLRAREAPNREVEPNGSTKARDVGEPARVPTVDTRRFGTAEGQAAVGAVVASTIVRELSSRAQSLRRELPAGAARSSPSGSKEGLRKKQAELD